MESRRCKSLERFREHTPEEIVIFRCPVMQFLSFSGQKVLNESLEKTLTFCMSTFGIIDIKFNRKSL